jgi:hypothetical protein
MKHKKIYAILLIAIMALTLSYPVIAKDKSDGSIEEEATDQEQAVATVVDSEQGKIAENKVAAVPAATVNLPFFKTYTSANYVIEGIGARNTGRGTVNLRVPYGSSLIDAWVYWKVLNSPSAVGPYDKRITVNGISKTGSLIGSGISPCWGPAGTTGYTYRANIKQLLLDTYTTGGDYGITVGDVYTGITNGRSPFESFSLPAAEDVEIVIVYSGTGTVTIYNGYYEQSGGIATFSVPTGSSKFSDSVGDGQILGITPYTKSLTYSLGIVPTVLQKVALNGIDSSITSKATHQGSLADTDTFILPGGPAPAGQTLTWNLANDCVSYDVLIFSSTVG